MCSTYITMCDHIGIHSPDDAEQAVVWDGTSNEDVRHFSGGL